jgi:aminopeptidase N
VKTPGMPEYDWQNDHLLVQRTDSVSNRIWQQPLLVRRGVGLNDTTLNMFSSDAASLPGTSDARYLNADGFSYGYFRLDNDTRNKLLDKPNANDDPVFRGAMWMNIWESMVRGDGPSPDQMITCLLNALEVEENPLLVDYLLGNLQTVWWTFLSDHTRDILQTETEKVLWKQVNKGVNAGLTNSYFRCYRNLALSVPALDNLEGVWNGKLKIKLLTVSEEDRITLAYELALKRPDKQQHYLLTQLSETMNPDRKARMQFVIPALNGDKKVRDEFFESLKQEVNREHEPWVLEALNYLHHPLRSHASIEYLRSSLDLLQEIQLTGDIFFPQRWLQTTFDNYSSAEAIEIVNKFLIDNPDYPLYLKNKILQSIDLPKRAVGLQTERKKL